MTDKIRRESDGPLPWGKAPTDRCEFVGGPWDGQRRDVARGVEQIPAIVQSKAKACTSSASAIAARGVSSGARGSSEPREIPGTGDPHDCSRVGASQAAPLVGVP